MSTILGYWIEDPEAIYFVRGPQDILPHHKGVFNRPLPGVTITPVTEHADIAPFVVMWDKTNNINGGQPFYTKWTPESPVPLEHDHDGNNRFEVLDFAETVVEAESICQQLRK